MYCLFTWFVKLTGGLPYLLAFRPKITYENKKVQSRRIKSRAIVISNHRDLLDFATVMFTFPFRTMRCAVAELMYEKNIFMTLFLRLLGTVKVDRNTHDFGFISTCSKILDKGGVVEIFPESKLPEPEDELPLEFKPSFVYLALKTGAPIIPVCHNGRYFDKKRLRINIGTPIYARELYRDDLSEKENVSNITTEIRRKIIEFQEQLEKQE